jgi:hypothetical protein
MCDPMRGVKRARRHNWHEQPCHARFLSRIWTDGRKSARLPYLVDVMASITTNFRPLFWAIRAARVTAASFDSVR